jgi:hypothetical protein
MAKEWFFFDSAGTRRRVKKAYFYDSSNARRTVKAGYFYDSAGVRRQFYVGGLAGPVAGYYPGANFTIQVGQDAGGTIFGWTGGGVGEIALEQGYAGSFAAFPSTDAFAKASNLFIAQRVYSNNRMQFYWYREGVTQNPPEWFEAVNVVAPDGSVYDTFYRGTMTLTLNPPAFGSGYQVQQTYANPLNVGNIYTYQFKELALNATVTPGTGTGVASGFLLGVAGSISVGTMRGLTVHGHWIDSNGTLNFAVRVPNSTDIGRSWLAWCHGNGSSSHNNKLAKDATSYTFTDSGAGYWIAKWQWTAFGTASTPYTLQVA